MKSFNLGKLSIFLIIVVLFFGCSKKEVNGEVFVITKSAGNIKLGLVTVYFLTQSQYKLASDTTSDKYKSIINQLNIMDSVNNFNLYMRLSELDRETLSNFKKLYDLSGNKTFKKMENDDRKSYQDNLLQATNYKRYTTNTKATTLVLLLYADSLKTQVISDKTNSEGKFKVELKNEKYWVFAISTRKVADSEEEYRWMFEYTPDEKPLFLSNDNVMKEDTYSIVVK